MASSIVDNSGKISMVKGKKGEQDSLENTVDGVVPFHGKFLCSQKKATSGVEGVGCHYSGVVKGRQRRFLQFQLTIQNVEWTCSWITFPIQ